MRLVSFFLFIIFFQINCFANQGMLQGSIAQTSCQSLSGTGFYSNLSFYYNFDGSGAIASTVTPTVGSTGTVIDPNGLGMSYVNGNSQQGIKFGGDDYIKFGTATSVTTTYTVSFWVKPGALASGSFLFHRGDANACFYNPSITLNSSTGALAASESGCGGTGIIASTTISLTKWTHVVVVRGAGIGKLYINGSLIGSLTPIPTTSPLTGGRFTVGASWSNTSATYSQFTDSTIDDLAIMTVALTASDVAALYASQNCNR